MKTGIIRRIDDLGRIVIPKEIRRKLGITAGDPLELSLDGNKVVFEMYIPTCDYEDSIKKIIARLEEDEFLGAEQRGAISSLEEAIKALERTNRERR